MEEKLASSALQSHRPHPAQDAKQQDQTAMQ
jgi:hypothetical protein